MAGVISCWTDLVKQLDCNIGRTVREQGWLIHGRRCARSRRGGRVRVLAFAGVGGDRLGAAAAAATGIRTNRSALRWHCTHLALSIPIVPPRVPYSRYNYAFVSVSHVHGSAVPEREETWSHVVLSRRYPMPAMLGAARAYMHMHINRSCFLHS
jgi:hypothetical protein